MGAEVIVTRMKIKEDHTSSRTSQNDVKTNRNDRKNHHFAEEKYSLAKFLKFVAVHSKYKKK